MGRQGSISEGPTTDWLLPFHLRPTLRAGPVTGAKLIFIFTIVNRVVGTALRTGIAVGV